MAELKHLSVSSVTAYTRCPAGYHMERLRKSEGTPNAPLLFGKIFAKSLEALHKGDDPYVTFCEMYARADSLLSDQGKSMFIPPDHGVDLLRLYETQRYYGDPERYFAVTLPDPRVLVPIVGYMDLATPVEVVEFKTSRAVWNQERVNAHPQGQVYGYAYEQEYGRKPVCVRYVVLSTKELRIDEYLATPTAEGLEAFTEDAVLAYEGITNDYFPTRCGVCEACKLERKRNGKKIKGTVSDYP